MTRLSSSLPERYPPGFDEEAVLLDSFKEVFRRNPLKKYIYKLISKTFVYNIYIKIKKKKMKLLNIACGKRIHKDWVNIDFHKSDLDVIPVNVLKGLPFKDKTFDVVYSSHFLEHIKKEDADFLIF